MADQIVRKSSPALIAAAWLLVIAPTAWGLTHTVENALKLFTKSAPAGTSPHPATAVPSPGAAPAQR